MSANGRQALDRVEEGLVSAHRAQTPPVPDAAWRQALMRDVTAQGPHGRTVQWAASGSAVLRPFAAAAASLAVISLVYFLAADQSIAMDITDFYFNDPANYDMVQLVGL